MTRLVNVLMAALAVGALLVGGMMFAMGPHTTGLTFAALFETLGAPGAYSAGLEDVNTDSEMRFYAVFWFAFGLWIIAQLRADSPNRNWVLIGAGLFWVGGWGRVLSYLATGGWPEPLFVGLAIIELVAPPLVMALHLAARGKADPA